MIKANTIFDLDLYIHGWQILLNSDILGYLSQSKADPKPINCDYDFLKWCTRSSFFNPHYCAGIRI